MAVGQQQAAQQHTIVIILGRQVRINNPGAAMPQTFGIEIMETTIKKITIRLTKEDTRILEFLQKQLGESQSQVIRRALNNLFEGRQNKSMREKS
jgi:Ribbon-helix-helix protein, copG family